MPEFKLQIRTISPTAPGTGEGRAGVLDREVVHDDLGIPIIPARRLKGLLLEAAREVWETLAHFDNWRQHSLVEPEDLFGRGGQPQPGPYQLSDAVVPDYEQLRAWIAEWRVKSGGERYFHVESVLRAFTEQRSQTALDRGTGSAKTNSLRVTRVLRSEQDFVAQGAVEGPDQNWDAKALRTLHLAARELRRMGLSRNRGTGRIDVRVECSNPAFSKIEWNPGTDELTNDLASSAKPVSQPSSGHTAPSQSAGPSEERS